jgi:hypothetical protein
MYCNNANGKALFDKKQNVLIRLIPMLLSQRNSFFSYKLSRFRIEKSKESTARVVMYKEFGIANSYTLETSMHGRFEHMFTGKDLRKIGKDFTKTLLTFVNQSVFR